MKSNADNKLDGFLGYTIRIIKNLSTELSPLKNIKSLNKNISGDIISGIMVAIVALPLALAFGEMSGLGPVAGIWSAVVGGVIGGLLGGSMVGVSGPTAPMASQIAIFMGAFIIGTTDQPDLGAVFSIIFLSGLILVFISMIKISRLIHYIPYSAIAGFMCGIGVLIILSQINAFLGMDADNNINLLALYVAVPSLIVLFLWEKLQLKLNILAKIPSTLAALIIGTGIAYIMNLDIIYIGDKVNFSNNEIFKLHIPDFTRIIEFIGPAIALAGLAVIDSLLSCKVADNMTGLRHSSDRETFGQGVANMTAGLIGGLSTATATTQTVGNITFGAKTPLATIVKGLTLLGVLFGLGNLVAIIPNACLAAILFKLGIEILDYRILPILKRLPLADLLVFVVVLFITVFQDLMVAVAIGVIFASINSFKEFQIIFKSTYQHVIIPFSESIFSLGEKAENLLVSVLQPKGPLFFGTVESLRHIYHNAPEHKILIVDMSHITTIDLSGAYALEDIINNAQTKGINVIVSNANSKVNSILENVNFAKNIGESHYNKSKESINSIVLNLLENNNE